MNLQWDITKIILLVCVLNSFLYVVLHSRSVSSVDCPASSEAGNEAPASGTAHVMALAAFFVTNCFFLILAGKYKKRVSLYKFTRRRA